MVGSWLDFDDLDLISVSYYISVKSLHARQMLTKLDKINECIIFLPILIDRLDFVQIVPLISDHMIIELPRFLLVCMIWCMTFISQYGKTYDFD